MTALSVMDPSATRWDIASLGEVMLRLDPGDRRIHTTRRFDVWEGGGEYNVARGLRRCFGQRATVLTALADNAVGRLIEDLILQGGVDTSYLQWLAYDGVGRSVRNGLNFTERGFGARAAVGCSDRGHSAASQLALDPAELVRLFERERARWLHTGGIFAALGEATPAIAKAAMTAAREAGTRVSYDLNFRPSLWKANGGSERATQVNRELLSLVDVVLGNEEDFSAALGFEVAGLSPAFDQLETNNFRAMMRSVAQEFPNLKVIATSLRSAHSASTNGWGAIAFDVIGGEFYEVRQQDFEVLDRVGGGDSFASGLIFGLLNGRDLPWALECGVAHGALAMTTPGDTSMARVEEVERLMRGKNARIER